MNPLSKTLIILGTTLILAGLIGQVGGKYFSLGKLPGDLLIERENLRFYFPMTTSIILSLLLSLIAYIVRKLNH
jgi:hypothetical protein